MILPTQFTKVLANIPLSTRELRNRQPKKSDFVIFLQTKAAIELIHAKNDIAFVTAAPFSSFVCKLARVVDLVSCGSTKSNTMPF